ncbi:MAG: hypothetical protein U0800_24400, partial [Isosphaeraceae bacterium]
PHTDPRGLVVEPMGPDDLSTMRNVHVVWTEPGCIRGNHYHVRGSEITLGFGPFLLRYRDGGEVRDVAIAEGEVVRVRIPAGVAHAFRNTGDKPLLLIGFNTEEHDRSAPDVVADRLI